MDTLADVVRPRGRRVTVKLLLRRSAVVLLVLIVVLGGLGAFGVHSATARAEGGGYTLTLRYAKVGRAGLDVPFQVTVSRPEGFPDDVELAVSMDYFRIFESQGFEPSASAETSDGTWYYLTFDRPPATTFQLNYDAYIQPSSQHGSGGEVRLLIGGKEQAGAHFHTYLLP